MRRPTLPRSPFARLGLLALCVAAAVTAWGARGERPGALALPGVLAALAGSATTEARGRRANALIREKSPYLLQHAYNPVDWMPWGEAAFARARAEDKPIFLSIGYSTCHWCHVMERESFENDSVAALLNQWFVSIKVDREERPDVDRIYMTAMQTMGSGGGWPLNVFLTPDLEPFFGGTYFPPTSNGRMTGMTELLPRVHEAWTGQRADIERSGRQVIEALAGLSAPDHEAVALDSLLDRGWHDLVRNVDPEQGGFGRQPKFPSVVNLNFLLRRWAGDPARNDEALRIVLAQLDAMRAGGIHDQLGGGFHRYATDRHWMVPHFEKMLYDQAQLASIYLDAFRITGDARHAVTARGIFDYVARDLTAKAGGFDSAEDADSEGEEGRFYVWTPSQIAGLLGSADAALVAHRYGVTPEGNFEHGTTILHEAAGLDAVAARAGIPQAEATKRLDEARHRLLDARARRTRPHRDDKILTAWNGLMISALARGARGLGEPELALRAARAAEFVWSTLRDPRDGSLRRRWRDGEAAGAGQLDDYAYFALGCLDLYAATFDPQWLERAIAVTEAQIERFWDEADGGFFESPPGDPSIAVRMKDGFDGAEMAGNSIAAFTLLTLADLLDRADWREKARRTLDHYARRLADQPAAMPQMLAAMDRALAVPRHVVIAGDPRAADTQALVAAFESKFRPHDLLLVVDERSRARLTRMVPFVAPLVAQGGRATAYVCVQYACRLPSTDPKVFARQLDVAETSAERPGR